MKTKIIPFDLEIAKKIQAGEIKGRIVQANGLLADILAYDINGSNLAIRFTREDESEGVDEYQSNGKIKAEWCKGAEDFALLLEVPYTYIKSKHEPQFKPFDKVLVRYPDKTELCVPNSAWLPGIFQYKSNNSNLYFVSGKAYKDCIPYEGNEHLVGTTDKPKED